MFFSDRCLETALLVSKNLNISEFDIEENARETLGEDTCDARRYNAAQRTACCGVMF